MSLLYFVFKKNILGVAGQTRCSLAYIFVVSPKMHLGQQLAQGHARTHALDCT